MNSGLETHRTSSPHRLLYFCFNTASVCCAITGQILQKRPTRILLQDQIYEQHKHKACTNTRARRRNTRAHTYKNTHMPENTETISKIGRRHKTQNGKCQTTVVNAARTERRKWWMQRSFVLFHFRACGQNEVGCTGGSNRQLCSLSLLRP